MTPYVNAAHAMTVRGLAERTKECYTDAVARMARHYHRSPDLLSPPEIEAYLCTWSGPQLSYSSVNHAASASRFLFETVLGRASDIVHLRPPMARVQNSPLLPRVPPVSCSRSVYRTVLQTIYAAGLRISEACALRVDDIDSAPDRMRGSRRRCRPLQHPQSKPDGVAAPIQPNLSPSATQVAGCLRNTYVNIEAVHAPTKRSTCAASSPPPLSFSCWTCTPSPPLGPRPHQHHQPLSAPHQPAVQTTQNVGPSPT